MSSNTTLVWFRRDLRLGDNQALCEAAGRGGAVVPVFVWAPEVEGAWAPGAAGRWWLHQSLRALDAALRERGSRLILRQGESVACLLEAVRDTGAGAVCWSRCYGPARRDQDVEAALVEAGIEARSFPGALLSAPEGAVNKQGKPYQVFTPFWKAQVAGIDSGEPLATPKKLKAPQRWPASLQLEELALEPSVDWTGGLRGAWQPGERGADAALDRFLDEALSDYADARDRPDLPGTSRLSPHLHFGEISPGCVWHAVRQRAATEGRKGLVRGEEAYLRQLAWREFAYHLLVHFPHTTDEPLRPAFARFPWREDAPALRAWQEGRTGYPLVDAGMRELRTTGWMHNRVRMSAASFLVKHLLVPWQTGARWFWDTLVDADLANNTLGWQWTAGCGADAAPYFRIFNPVLQGKRFDPAGNYVRRWVPELAKLPARWIHSPWQAPAGLLDEARVVLGDTYPSPIVEHKAARERALLAYEAVKAQG